VDAGHAGWVAPLVASPVHGRLPLGSSHQHGDVEKAITVLRGERVVLDAAEDGQCMQQLRAHCGLGLAGGGGDPLGLPAQSRMAGEAARVVGPGDGWGPASSSSARVICSRVPSAR
jgi:hypothetical protein